jgi:hypothetical protein
MQAKTVNQLKGMSKNQLMNQSYQILAKAYGSNFIGKSKEVIVEGILESRNPQLASEEVEMPIRKALAKAEQVIVTEVAKPKKTRKAKAIAEEVVA